MPVAPIRRPPGGGRRGQWRVEQFSRAGRRATTRVPRWSVVVVAAVVLATVAGCGRKDNVAIGEPGVPLRTGQAPSGQYVAAQPGGAVAPAAAAPGTFGDLSGLCGPGDAKGATDQGVTDSEIRVGTIADPGYAGSPGLDKEFFDTAKAFTKWCNDAGGINGRKIRVDLLDAAVLDVIPRMNEACAQDFTMVGGGAVMDDMGAQVRVDCGLPDVPGFVVTTKAAGADLLAQPVPNANQQQPVGIYRMMAERQPELKDAAGILTANFAALTTTADRRQEALEKLGFKVVYRQEYNVMGESNWAPFVAAMKDKGVKTLTFVGEPNMLVALQKAMDEQGWHPEAILQDASFYAKKYIDAGGSSVQKTYVDLVFNPLETADQHPAVQQYIDILKASDPSAQPSLLGMQGLTAWLLWAKAAKDCGSTLTRACLLEKARSVTEWTGGGLHSPTNPSTGEAPRCSMVVEATPKGYEKVTPDGDDFSCDDANRLTLTTQYTDGAKRKG